MLYPGLDLKTHDDTGPLDGPIRMSGLVIGDDYIAQANALEAAFRKAGPATLIHPWRGPIRCVLFRPAQFEYDVKELRVVRIDAEFDPVTSAGLASLGTSLSQALSGLVGLLGSASGLAQAAIAASPMAYALYGRAIAATAGTIDARRPLGIALAPIGRVAAGDRRRPDRLHDRDGAAAAGRCGTAARRRSVSPGQAHLPSPSSRSLPPASVRARTPRSWSPRIREPVQPCC